MARYSVPQMSDFPYHITARCPNRRPFLVPLPEVWKLFNTHLSLAHLKRDLRIHSIVLMPNHFHLICSTPRFPIGTVMSEFLGGLSKELNAKAGTINQNWGSRHHKCVLSSFHYYLNCYKYVYQNPVRAGLCRQAQDWPYSSLHGLMGASRLSIPLEKDTILFNPNFDFEQLNWINQIPCQEDLKAFRKALTKREFRLPKIKRTQAHPLESRRI